MAKLLASEVPASELHLHRAPAKEGGGATKYVIMGIVMVAAVIGHDMFKSSAQACMVAEYQSYLASASAGKRIGSTIRCNGLQRTYLQATYK